MVAQGAFGGREGARGDQQIDVDRLSAEEVAVNPPAERQPLEDDAGDALPGEAAGGLLQRVELAEGTDVRPGPKRPESGHDS